ncbi:mitochondrial fission 1 protein [Trichuris trichiura]|uniref:Mitochondrial fission 1 protein n=1 Tax=Trichuris trichiura TaxID=36087 RepID=A0A077ZAD3_TRITR|nr:mitochondrial fission 1 protein [Trichuris trichiura]
MPAVDSIIDERVDPQELKVYTCKLVFNVSTSFVFQRFEAAFVKELEQGHASTQTTFEYANFLIRSTKNDVILGLRLFEGDARFAPTIALTFFVSIHLGVIKSIFADLLNQDDQGDAKRDYLYFLAIGNIKLKNYDKALSYVDAILRVEPANKQAEELRTVICNRMYRGKILSITFC